MNNQQEIGKKMEERQLLEEVYRELTGLRRLVGEYLGITDGDSSLEIPLPAVPSPDPRDPQEDS